MNSIQKETIKFYTKQLRVPTFNNYEKIIRQLSVDDSYEQFLKQELAELYGSNPVLNSMS